VCSYWKTPSNVTCSGCNKFGRGKSCFCVIGMRKCTGCQWSRHGRCTNMGRLEHVVAGSSESTSGSSSTPTSLESTPLVSTNSSQKTSNSLNSLPTISTESSQIAPGDCNIPSRNRNSTVRFSSTSWISWSTVPPPCNHSPVVYMTQRLRWDAWYYLFGGRALKEEYLYVIWPYLGVLLGSPGYTFELLWVGEIEALTEVASTQPNAAFAAFTHGFTSKRDYFSRTVPEAGHCLPAVECTITTRLILALTGRPFPSTHEGSCWPYKQG